MKSLPKSPQTAPPLPGDRLHTDATPAVVLPALFTGLVAASLSPILIRLGEAELSPHAIVFHRSWLAVLMVVGLEVLSRRTSPNVSEAVAADTPDWRADWPAIARSLLLLGTTFAIAVLSWAWSLSATTVSNSSLLHSFTPLFSGLFAWFAYGQRFGNGFWVGTAIALSGVFVLEVREFGFEPAHLWGDAGSLFSAVFFGTEPVSIARLRQRLGTYTILAWNYGIVAVLTLPLLWLFPMGAMPASGRGWLTLLAMALLCQVVGFGLLAYCLKFVTAGVISLAHLTIPLFSASIAWPVFDEPVSWTSAIAFAIVLSGIAVCVSAPEQVPAAE